MPAVSRKQRRAAAIALHQPAQLHARNAGMATMSLSKLAQLARTPEKRLPVRVSKRKKKQHRR